jgi:hypothetical protein
MLNIDMSVKIDELKININRIIDMKLQAIVSKKITPPQLIPIICSAAEFTAHL